MKVWQYWSPVVINLAIQHNRGKESQKLMITRQLAKGERDRETEREGESSVLFVQRQARLDVVGHQAL